MTSAWFRRWDLRIIDVCCDFPGRTPDVGTNTGLRYARFVPGKLPLEEMTLKEKLAAMELLWEDLVRAPESVESPKWHQDVLDDRSQRVAEGTSQFTDWEQAKAEIRKKLK